MAHRLLHKKHLGKLLPSFVANLFVSFHINTLVYVNSSFLERFFGASGASGLFILAALGNFLFFYLAVRLEKRFGNRKFLLFFILAQLVAVAGLAVVSSPLAIALLFIIFQSTSLMLLYSMDIFLEDATEENQTGTVRGIYLTLGNLALVFSPLMIALVAPDGEFRNLYMFSVLFLLPFFLISTFFFKGFKDGPKRFGKLPLLLWWEAKNIRRVSLVRLSLDVFYSIMVVFMPIYLSKYIGFSWTEIAFIFTIMLLPFVLFEVPVGRLADRWCGEKELMTVGLFIIGAAVLIIPFLHTPNVLLWAMLLFSSRIGASMVEITAESYFFKHVNKNDTGFISMYRLSWPVAFIIGPLIGGLSLYFMPFEAMFFILALFIFKSMDSSTKLVDTL